MTLFLSLLFYFMQGLVTTGLCKIISDLFKQQSSNSLGPITVNKQTKTQK